MTDSDERICTCALNMVFGFEPRIALALVESLGSAKAVFGLDTDALKTLLGPEDSHIPRIGPATLDAADKELSLLQRIGARLLCHGDGDYPAALKECPDPPICLYFKGCEPPGRVFRRRPYVSVVGTRDMTPYGQAMCSETVRTLSTCSPKPAIVSGLALGIDAVAHRTALDTGLSTIAVLPIGIDGVYPRQHSPLAGRIAGTPGCALVTDYPTGTSPSKVNFLRRNRIIAGFSRVTVLVESKVRGGGMMTARLAHSYDRQVFAVPGRMDDLRSQGCNVLIRQNIAEPLVDVHDFVRGIRLRRAPSMRALDIDTQLRGLYEGRLSPAFTDTLQTVAQCIRDHRGISQEEICGHTSLTYSQVASAVGVLRSDGIIETDLLQRCSLTQPVKRQGQAVAATSP